MEIKNPIPKVEREKLKDLFKLKDALIKKGVITDAEIKAKKEKWNYLIKKLKHFGKNLE